MGSFRIPPPTPFSSGLLSYSVLCCLASDFSVRISIFSIFNEEGVRPVFIYFLFGVAFPNYYSEGYSVAKERPPHP